MTMENEKAIAQLEAEPIDGLPDGWARTTIGELHKTYNQVNPQKSPHSTFEYVDISSIDNRINAITGTTEIEGKDAPSRARKPISTGDIVFSTVRPYLKNVALVSREHHGKVCSTGFCVIKPIYAEFSKWIFRYVLTDDYIRAISQDQRGISYPAVSEKKVYSSQIPLPPLAEQRRIVAKVEAVLGHVERARAALRQAKDTFARRRAAILAKAFRGELVAQDPKDEPAIELLKRIRTQRLAAEPNPKKRAALAAQPLTTTGPYALPAGWEWTFTFSVASVFVGATPSRKNEDYWNGSIPWVSSGEVQFCRIASTKEHISRFGLDSCSALIHPPGTVMLGMIGEGKTRGQAAILDIEASNNQNCAAIRCEQCLIPEFLYFWLMVQYDKNRNLGSGNNQKALNKARVATMRLPFTSVQKQRRIVAKIEELFAVEAAAEAAVDAALAQLDTLPQSILAKAFRGQLVETEASIARRENRPYEPAAELLKRIQAEKSVSDSTPTRRPRKSAK